MLKYEVSKHSPAEGFYTDFEIIEADDEKEAVSKFCEIFFHSRLFEYKSPFIIWAKERIIGSDKHAALFRQFGVEVEPSFNVAEVR